MIRKTMLVYGWYPYVSLLRHTINVHFVSKLFIHHITFDYSTYNKAVFVMASTKTSNNFGSLTNSDFFTTVTLSVGSANHSRPQEKYSCSYFNWKRYSYGFPFVKVKITFTFCLSLTKVFTNSFTVQYLICMNDRWFHMASCLTEETATRMSKVCLNVYNGSTIVHIFVNYHSLLTFMSVLLFSLHCLPFTSLISYTLTAKASKTSRLMFIVLVTPFSPTSLIPFRLDTGIPKRPSTPSLWIVCTKIAI